MLGESLAEVLDLELDIDAELITDGQRAIERLNGPVVDVVFLDLHLPHVSGMEILDQIRADTRWADTIVIVITADIVGANKAKDKANIVLQKPIDIPEIGKLADQLVR
jgi:two-component system cell cycle response regulator DivK